MSFDPRAKLREHPLPDREEPGAEGPETLADKLIGQLLSADDLINRPAPAWIIDDVIPAGGTVVLFGKPGSGKSFTALDWSICAALGLPWQGREVTKGDVLYIAAEGVAGLGIRVHAWKIAFGVTELPNIRFYPGSINLLDVDRRVALVEVVRRLKPALLVIDTMARSMTGGDENSAKDVGLVIGAIDACRAELPDLTALIVHHMDKGGTTYRGSSALEGAAETMIECADDDGAVVLSCEKQKDAEQFDKIRVKRAVVELPSGLTSCVLRAVSSENLSENLPENRRGLLNEFLTHFSATGANRTQLRAVTKLPDATFYRALNDLVNVGALVNAGTQKVPFYVKREAA